MRSIAFIWAVAVISAALAQGASAQEKIRLAQSSTVTNCMMNCNAQVTNCRTTCLVPVTPPAASPASSSSPPPFPMRRHHHVLVELQFDPPHVPVELCAAIAIAIMLFAAESLL